MEIKEAGFALPGRICTLGGIVTLLITLLMADAVNAQSQPTDNQAIGSHSNSKHPQTQKNIRGTMESPLIVKVVDTDIPHVILPAQPTEQKSWFWRYAGDPNAVFASVVAFFTIVLTCVTNRQAKLTKEALVTTERAFVFLKALNASVTNNATGTSLSCKLQPLWGNSGKTPTRSMFIRVNWTPWPGDLPTEFPYTYNDDTTSFHLGPGAECCSKSFGIPAHEIANMRNGGSNIYIWGRVDYVDTFSIPHYTQFCFQMDITGNGGEEGITISFNHYGKYSGSDNNHG